MSETEAPRGADYKRTVVNAVLLLMVSQGIFWLALALAESSGRPDSLPQPAAVTMVFADIEGIPLPDVSPAAVPLIAEPAYVYRDSERHPRVIIEHVFDLPSSDVDYGVMLGWGRHVRDVQLNGLPLKTQSPIDVWGILSGHEPVLYSFPAEYVEDEGNRLTFLLSGRSMKIMPPFFIGELTELYAANTWLRVFSVDLVVVSIGVLIFAILLNTLIHWSQEERIRVTAMNVLLIAWTLRNITFLGIDGGFPDPFRLLFHFVVTYVFLFSFLVFAIGWTRRSRSWFMWTGAVFAACVGIISVATTISAQALFDTAFALETAITLAVGGVSLWLFADYWTRTGRAETVEILLFLVCAGAIVADAVDDQWQISIPFSDLPLTFYAAPMCGLLLALGIVASLAAQSTRARIATEGVNELLKSRLKQQEERLNESHARETEVEKNRVLLEERQRIIRDMHDGVGGSLMSLLLRARRGDLKNETLVRSLSTSMNDLRLIIDSFDHVGDNLEFALSIFRQRVEPELAANNVKLHYKTSAAEAIGGFGPESVLQIYRILQEACNNAVNHGGARNINIDLLTDPANRRVLITIRDDGSGFDEDEVSHGRGLDNMRHRAARIGGDLSIVAGAPEQGTKVTLTFPMRDVLQELSA